MSLTEKANPDEFRSESPIRAFTSWDRVGSYAVGKGFRPSVAHLATYLNALYAKEGLSLVQIIEAENPTMIFHRQDDRQALDEPVRPMPPMAKPYRAAPFTLSVEYGQGMRFEFTLDDLRVALSRMPVIADILHDTVANNIRSLTHKNWPTVDETRNHLLKLSSEQGKDTAIRCLKSAGVDSAKEIPLMNQHARAALVDTVDDFLAHPPVIVEQDMVNHPPHYNEHPSGLECIQIKRHMPSNIGDAFKYIWRAGSKGDTAEDIQKALWYARDEMKLREAWQPMLKDGSTGSYFRQAMLADGIGKKFTSWAVSRASTREETERKAALLYFYQACELPSTNAKLALAIRHCNRMLQKYGVKPEIDLDDND